MEPIITRKKFAAGIRRSAARMWKPALAVLLVLTAVHGLATIILGRRFEAEVSAIKAKGNPVSLTDLAGKPLPDELNKAVVYYRIFNRLKSESAKKDDDTFDKLMTCEQNLISGTKNSEPDPGVEAKAAADRMAFIMPMVQEALKRPQCKFKVKWSDGYAATLPHYGQLRKLIRVLNAMAIVQAREGSMDQAYSALYNAMKVSTSIENDQMLIAFLVMEGNVQRTSSAIQAVLLHGDFTEAQSKALYDILGNDYTRPFVAALKGDRVGGLWGFDMIRKHGPYVVNEWFGGHRPSGTICAITAYAWKPFGYANASLYLKKLAEQIDMASQPYRLTKRDPSKDALPWYAKGMKPLMFSSRDMSANKDDIRAQTAETQILLAARVFKTRFGSYPESLVDLQAKLGWKLPKDPFSGRDLIYMRTANGFHLRSIGHDLKDDGGTPYKQQPYSKQPSEKGDVVLNWDR